jgi:hypothetical protein
LSIGGAADFNPLPSSSDDHPSALQQVPVGEFEHRDDRRQVQLRFAQHAMMTCNAAKPSVRAAGPGCKINGDFIL